MTRKDLRKHYRNPPLEHRPVVFWVWLGDVTPGNVKRQLAEMHRDGITRVLIYSWGGLRSPRYLSEEWFDCIGASLQEGRRLGMHVGLPEELGWPSGEVRDYWEPHVPSRVLHERPASRMKRISYGEETVEGPRLWTAPEPSEFLVATAAQVTGPEQIDSGSILTIAPDAAGELSWEAPSGTWLVQVFQLVETTGCDGGLVNMMDREAMRILIRLVNEEYERRFGEYFGNTVPLVCADSEGSYGDRIAWAPELLTEYHRRYDSDLLRELPLLMYDGGSASIKTRCQYLDVVSDLYTERFWGEVTDWWEERGVTRTGHTWEESLQRITAWVGDLMRIQRRLTLPGVDSLQDWALSPRDQKETESVAHFEDRQYWIEHPSGLGADRYPAPRTYRPVTNAALLWGAGVMFPTTIFSDPEQDINFSAPWPRNPWSRYYGRYLDYAQRACFVHGTGRHRAPLLVYQPLEAVWAYASPMFAEQDESPGPGAVEPDRGFGWDNLAGETNRVYNEVKEVLVRAGWDYDVADRHYLSQARIESGRLHIGGENFTALVLPPAPVVYRRSMQRAAEFARAGGTVLAVGRLPNASPEHGLDDPEILMHVAELFGESPQPGLLREVGDSGGKAMYVNDSGELLEWLHRLVERDMQVLDAEDTGVETVIPEHWPSTIPPLEAYPGWAPGLMAGHWELDGLHFYWVLNEKSRTRRVNARFAVRGRVEKWDPLTGDASPLGHHITDGGTEVTLEMGPWDAFHVVIDPARTGDQEAPRAASGPAAPAVTLDSPWLITPHREVPVVYARTRLDPGATGEAEGWHLPDLEDTDWDSQWLSPERFGIRDWSVIGPFPYGIFKGHWTAYPPEEEIDLEAVYEGLDIPSLGESARAYTGMPQAPQIIEPGDAIPDKFRGKVRWQQVQSDNYILNVDDVLGTASVGHVLGYALTFVWSPTDRDAELRVVGDNSWRVWLNGDVVAERPGYISWQDFREMFGVSSPVRLHSGWNAVLVKVGKGYRAATGVMGLMCRFCDAQGHPLPDLIVSAKRELPPPPAAAPGLIWYRVRIPPGTGRLALPPLSRPAAVFINGRRREIGADGSVELPPPGADTAEVAAIACDAREELTGILRFLPAEGPVELGSWIHNGLTHYVGEATYRTTFQLTGDHLDADLVLDLGEVGVVADVRVNGHDAGTGIWPPYAFNISGLCRAGGNELEVVVYNSDAALRAQGEFEMRIGSYQALVNTPGLLDKLECNGLLGPVRIEARKRLT
jgi:hypothetical protein